MSLQRLETPCSCSIRWTPGQFSHTVLPGCCLWRGSSYLSRCLLFYVTNSQFSFPESLGWHLCHSIHQCHLGHASRFACRATHADTWVSQALSTRPDRVCIASSRSLYPQYSVFCKALNIQCFSWHGQEDILLCKVCEGDTYRERCSDSFPSADLGATRQFTVF